MGLFSWLGRSVPPPPDIPTTVYVDQRVRADGKQFQCELQYFTDRIFNRENFSLVRFGDGEMVIIEGKAIDLSEKYNGEHRYVPGTAVEERQRELLAASLCFKRDNYFVGIACPCCVGQSHFMALKKQSGLEESQLTWANLFVNANYQTFLERTVPAMATRTVNIVCHEQANVETLPFSVNRRFSVGPNSWVNDHERLRAELGDYVKSSRSEDELFLFCAGVLSNISIYELSRIAPQHTYIDAGSVFDVTLGLGKTRKYLKKGRTLRKVCRWN